MTLCESSSNDTLFYSTIYPQRWDTRLLEMSRTRPIKVAIRDHQAHLFPLKFPKHLKSAASPLLP